LAATGAGIPDPLIEVDDWLDRLRDLLDAGPETAHEAYDLLALWGKLRRVRPEMLTQLQAADVLERADSLLSERGRELTTQALTIPNPSAWLEETAQLEAAYEEPAAPEIRSALAERLLSDLDDADLVLDAARRHGQDSPELAGELDRCQEWLAEHADMFLAASVHVQAVGLAMRPDLAEQDYGLAVTALKYVDVLHAAETAEAQLALADVQPLARGVVLKLVARYQQERLDLARTAFAALAIALRAKMRPRPLARAGDETVLEPLLWWEWAAPAGDLIGRLTIPPQPVEDETVTLKFVGLDGRPATHLAGQRVVLHGIEASIDSRGRTTFPLVRLLETEEPLVLRVGPDQTAWPLKLNH
jgi:hypothetical protein